MSTEADGYQETLEGILPTEAPTHGVKEAPRHEFQPWHLPRKQHLRTHQWGAQLDRLLEDLPDRRLVRYLCLPGEDLLDIEVLARVCQSRGRRLHYLGFDRTAKQRQSTQRSASEQIVRQTEIVEPTSLVIPDEFVSIVRPGTLGRQHFRDGGSYDAVNLDLCDAFTTHEGTPTHRAVFELLEHQANLRAQPWLLFLTTRSEVDRLRPDEVMAYKSAISRNAAASATFCETLAEIAGHADCTDRAALLDALLAAIRSDTFLAGRWLTIGIGKWLLGIMASRDPWRVDLLSAYSYRTGLLSTEATRYAKEPPNLFSMVFRFEKVTQVRTDPAGLARRAGSHVDGEFNEVKLAEKLARCVHSYTTDLDRALQGDTSARDDAAQDCESLLAGRHYSAEAYRAWIARLAPIPD